MEKKVFIYGNLVCSRRSLDTRKIYNYLKKNNYKIVKKPEKADIIVLNTCAYSNEVAGNSLNRVNEFKKFDAELIVVGCLPNIKKEELDEIFNGKKLVTKELDKIDEFFENKNVKFNEIEDTNVLWQNLNERKITRALKNFVEKSALSRTYYKFRDFKNIINKRLYGENSKLYNASILEEETYYLRISRGCFGNCSYCAIKKAIGPLKSKPIDQCVEEFKKGLATNYKIFRLGADDIGAYGMDIKTNFIELLKEMFMISGDYKIEIETISPRWIIKYMDELEAFLQTGRISMIFSAIQSANNRILDLMNRQYTQEELRDVFHRLKNYPNIRIGTEIIVGFPTESEEEFIESLDFIKEFNFEWGFLNPFSCMKDTPAENIKPYVSEEEILYRMMFSKKALKEAGYKILYYKEEHRNPIVLEFFKK